MTFFVCASMLPAWIFFCLSVKFFGQRSLRLIVNTYLIVTTACTTFVQINLCLASSLVLQPHCHFTPFTLQYICFAYSQLLYACYHLILFLLASVIHFSNPFLFFCSPGQQCFTYYL